LKNLQSLSELIENLQQLPTIGKKSATRMALYLIKNRFNALKIANSIENAVTLISECKECGNLTEHELCEICMSERENKICIIEHSKDIMIIEENQIYKGYYFVMPELENEKIEQLITLIKKKKIDELIFAYPHSIENEAKILYIEDRLKNLNIIFSQIAQGIPMGVHFENVDIISLNKAFSSRVILEK
jgi:recombination protein RecR